MPIGEKVRTRKVKFHIYKVEINGEIKLVRASSKAAAIRVAFSPITVSIPTPEELVDLVKQGIEVDGLND